MDDRHSLWTVSPKRNPPAVCRPQCRQCRAPAARSDDRCAFHLRSKRGSVPRSNRARLLRCRMMTMAARRTVNANSGPRLRHCPLESIHTLTGRADAAATDAKETNRKSKKAPIQIAATSNVSVGNNPKQAPAEAAKGLCDVVIPSDTDFTLVPGLRSETREKLQSIRPQSMAALRRIPGITAADTSIVAIWLCKGN